jgi:hypothetical protein
MKVALHLLTKAHPQAIPYGDLVAAVEAQVGQAKDPLAEAMAGDDPAVRNALANGLLQMFFAGVVGLHRMIPQLVSKPGDRPLATPLARLQARDQDWATNQWHSRVVLTPTQRAILEHLDGETSRGDIKRAIGKELTSAEPVGQAIKALANSSFLIA